MDVRSILRRHGAFSRLSEDAINQLSRHAMLQRLRRGAGLWQPGDRADGFIVIAHGLVKVQLARTAAREIVLGLAGPGESVGDAAAIEHEVYDGEATALTETVVIARLPRDTSIAALEGSGEAALALARLFSQATAAAHRRLVRFSAPAEERLATALMELGDRFGDELEDGSTLIPLRLTRAELAGLVGTTVETTIRTLSRWSREGLVSTHDVGMTLHDAAALARRCNTCAVERS